MKERLFFAFFYRLICAAPVPVHHALIFSKFAGRRRNCIFTKGPADMLDLAMSEIAIDCKLGIAARRRM
jgi:hypothetical protein